MKTIDINKYIGWLFGLLALLSGVHVIVWLFSNPSLWLDDAMLMKSVVTRDFAGLFQGCLDFNQSAPIGWLLIIKCFEILLGNTPFVLRLFGVVLYFASAVLIYLIARDVIKFRIPMIAVCVFMALNIVQNYAIATKPYMADVFMMLLATWLYHKYYTGSLSGWITFLVMAVGVWFVFGALFWMAGICAYQFFFCTYRILKKQIVFKDFINGVAPLLLVLVSVGLYYVLWCGPASENTPSVENNNYWTFLSFPLIPHSLADFKLMALMLRAFLSPINKIFLIQFVLAFIVSVVAQYRRWYVIAYFIMAIIVMTVSSLGLYPIATRLLLSQFVITLIIAMWGIDRCIADIAKNPVTLGLVVLVILLPLALNLRFTIDYRAKAFFPINEQYKKCIDYIDAHKPKDAVVYIANIQRPMAEYYTDYKESNVKSLYTSDIIEKNGLIWGTNYRHLHNDKAYEYKYYMLPDKVKDNIDVIQKYNKVYLIDVHREGKVIANFLDSLKVSGSTVEKVFSFLESHVYLCTTQENANRNNYPAVGD